MRKSANMLSHELLRRERQRRGWSREYVAEQIGVADPKTIGRWERGTCTPRAYFLQKLCTLFNMLPEDLGLLPEPALATDETYTPTTAPSPLPPWGTSHTRTPSQHPEPHPPSLPVSTPANNRNALLAYLERCLRTDNAFAAPAHANLSPSGKTTLTIELAPDRALLDHEPHDVLVIFLPLRES